MKFKIFYLLIIVVTGGIFFYAVMQFGVGMLIKHSRNRPLPDNTFELMQKSAIDKAFIAVPQESKSQLIKGYLEYTDENNEKIEGWLLGSEDSEKFPNIVSQIQIKREDINKIFVLLQPTILLEKSPRLSSLKEVDCILGFIEESLTIKNIVRDI